MITEEQKKRLQQFFGAYFHQDWDADFGTPEQALLAAIHHHPLAVERRELSRSIVEFVESHTEDSSLDGALLNELGCEYFPPGNGVLTRSWLLDVAAKLVASAGS
jgi:hypothetical protein